MVAGDVSFNMIANGVPTTLLQPGECNNTNGIFQFPITNATFNLVLAVTDADGTSRTQTY